jgi:Zn-dependent M28 family amino/carboxypeptidase
LSFVSFRLESFYREGWAPNVIGTIRGTAFPDEFVILGSHLDDRNTNSASTTTRAPGANDDGSGSAALLAIAKALYDSGSTFERTVSIEFYTGEEQGLVGSRAYARARSLRGDNVIAHIQQDMIGYHRAGDPAGVSFVQDRAAVDLSLTNYALGVAREFAPANFTVYTAVLSGSSCCSDHQSYVENGYPSVGLIEPRGYTGNKKSGSHSSLFPTSIHCLPALFQIVVFPLIST